VLKFGRFRLLFRRRQLIADGVPIEVGSRALDLLLTLIEADGSLVTKSELLRRVWPGIVVTEDNLKVQIAALRKALGKDRDFISTEFGRDYRFTAAVRAVAWNTCQWRAFGGSQPSQRWRARRISRPPQARRASRSLPPRVDAAGPYRRKPMPTLIPSVFLNQSTCVPVAQRTPLWKAAALAVGLALGIPSGPVQAAPASGGETCKASTVHYSAR
jgi:DNA-binding winged helix-turn-helix (wHTH) protein